MNTKDYLCKKTMNMDEGQRAFTKGKTYTFTQYNKDLYETLEDDMKDGVTHTMDFVDMKKYFKGVI